MEEASFKSRFKNAWNAFRGRDPTVENFTYDYGLSSSFRPDMPRFTRGNQRSIVAAVYNRIAMDCAAVDIEHVRVDEDGNYEETLKSGLNNCLTLDANLDQTSNAFVQDIVMSMFDEGCIAVIPIDVDDMSEDPTFINAYDILTMRVGRIKEWRPHFIKVDVYNENTGRHQELMWPKNQAAIIENPLYAVMNEPNSTLQRLLRTLNTLDRVNQNKASNKLDLIIQLPYVVKSDARRKQAEQRRADLEHQLATSRYGIAYADGTEKITQLNRAVEDNLWAQVSELTVQLYNQLGLTQSIFDGTADDKTLLQYYDRTVNPILTAISKEFMRKFLTKTARTQGQAIRFFRDPFKLIPVDQLAEISDKLTRNEIMTSNEIRSKIGLKPSDDPAADELRNKNLNANAEELAMHKQPQDDESSKLTTSEEK